MFGKAKILKILSENQDRLINQDIRMMKTREELSRLEKRVKALEELREQEMRIDVQ